MEALQRRIPPWLSPWCSPKFSSWSWFLVQIVYPLGIWGIFMGYMQQIPPHQKKKGLNKNRLSSWHHPFSDASASLFHGGYFLSTQDDRIHTCDRSTLGLHVQLDLIVITHPKTNMTMENQPCEDVFPIQNGFFQCHVSFQGCNYFRFQKEKWKHCWAVASLNARFPLPKSGINFHVAPDGEGPVGWWPGG